MEEPNKEFPEFFSEKLRERNVSFKKLAEITNIPEKHLENLAAGRFEDLPAAPYLRGYLMKIGEVLGFEGGEYWEKLRNEGELTGSGAYDTLPKNRFARRPVGKIVVAAVILIAIAGYFGLRFSSILGKPSLIIDAPREETTTIDTDRITISGFAKNASRVFINGEETALSAEGRFEKEVLLEQGLNTVEITAKKFLGRETKVIRRVFVNAPRATAGPEERAKEDLAGRLNVPPGDIEVARTEETVWRDSCIGIGPGPCLAVLTPGYRIWLQVGGKEYLYHTNRAESVRFAGETQ